MRARPTLQGPAPTVSKCALQGGGLEDAGLAQCTVGRTIKHESAPLDVVPETWIVARARRSPATHHQCLDLLDGRHRIAACELGGYIGPGRVGEHADLGHGPA